MQLPTLAELETNGREYAAAGFIGAMGSVDVVHIRQWAIAANLRQTATGKEQYPSRAYEVVVNHRKFILAVTPGWYGSVVDKTIVKFDKAMLDIRDGRYADYTYEVYNDEGRKYTMRGAYVLCDNGYLSWTTMMEPSKVSASVEESNWSEMCESLRKDVEGTFGIMKQMFAILKYGSRFTDQAEMDKIFMTCAALYNQRMMATGKESIHASRYISVRCLILYDTNECNTRWQRPMA